MRRDEGPTTRDAPPQARPRIASGSNVACWTDMHAVLIFSTIPLFPGAVLSDWAYAESYQVQWTNLASWLGAGGLPLAVAALV
jgi:hypothetical protein